MNASRCPRNSRRRAQQRSARSSGPAARANSSPRTATRSSKCSSPSCGAVPDLRRENAEALVALDFPAYAIGGLAVGEPHETTCAMAEIVTPILPPDRPRYLMGVGKPEDIADYVMRGVDLMDCVIPTRNARNGWLFTSRGRMVIRSARYADDPRPPDEDCSCPVCRRYSRAYLRHLFVSGEMLGPILNTLHNVHFYLERMRALRAAIADGTVTARAAQWKQEAATADEMRTM